jgi:hypothetical protein
MYVIDDETGKIGIITIEEGKSIPQRDMEEIIKVLAQNQKGD